jgi:hypothetical protein
MGLNYFASSPVLLPPQNSNPPHMLSQSRPEGGAVLVTHFRQQNGFSSRPFIPKYPTPPSLNYLARPSTATAGRKRSRDDIAEDMSDNESMSDSSASSDAYSERPALIARKSMRSEPQTSRNNYDEEIDPIIRQLGIGWKRTPETQTSAIAGSETFIKKQFPLNDPRILLHHEGLGIYVVRTEPAGAKGYWHQWWLFRDDLKSCRFLCNDDADLMRRLNNKRQDERGNWLPDILVEGPEVFARDVPPSPITALSPVNGVAQASNVEQMLFEQSQLQLQSQSQPQSQLEDVEMDGVV